MRRNDDSIVGLLTGNVRLMVTVSSHFVRQSLETYDILFSLPMPRTCDPGIIDWCCVQARGG